MKIKINRNANGEATSVALATEYNEVQIVFSHDGKGGHLLVKYDSGTARAEGKFSDSDLSDLGRALSQMVDG